MWKVWVERFGLVEGDIAGVIVAELRLIGEWLVTVGLALGTGQIRNARPLVVKLPHNLSRLWSNPSPTYAPSQSIPPPSPI